MTSAIDTTAAMSALQQPSALPAGFRTTDPVKAKQVAEQFEGMFITQFVGEMFSGMKTDGPFGGGQGEEMFRSLMMDEYGKQIASQGGFGLAASVQRELLKTQEFVAH
jgi:Rod binding domain-containing protein